MASSAKCTAEGEWQFGVQGKWHDTSGVQAKLFFEYAPSSQSTDALTKQPIPKGEIRLNYAAFKPALRYASSSILKAREHFGRWLHFPTSATPCCLRPI